MKGIKKISVIALSMAFAISMASCSGSSKTNTGNSSGEIAQKEEYKDLDKVVNQDYDYLILSSIAANTDNVKKDFFLGDTFSSDGLVVSANYFPIKDEKQGTIISQEITNYTIDSSAVDFSVVGQYEVVVSYRYMGSKATTTYRVNVKSAALESEANLTYWSGMKLSYRDDLQETKTDDSSIVRNVYKNSTYKFSSSDVSALLFTTHVNADLTLDVSKKGVSLAKVTPSIEIVNVDDPSNVLTEVDTSKVGLYVIKLTYTNPNKITVQGEQIDNKVMSFIYVNVIDPVISLSKTEGTETFSANAEGFDFSSWKFNVTRHSGTVEEVSYSSDLFIVSDYSSFVTGSQKVTFYLTEMPESETRLSYAATLNVTESTTHDIHTYLGLLYCDTKDGITSFYSKEAKDDDVVYVTGKNLTVENKGASGDYSGDANRVKVQTSAKDSYIDIKMEKAGKIVIYLAANDSSFVDFTLSMVGEKYNDDGYIVYNGSTEKAGAINYQNKQFVIDVNKAGTYRLQADASQIYVYGIAIAVSK